MKSYGEYASRAFALHFRHPRPDPLRRADEVNLVAVSVALEKLSERETELLQAVYSIYSATMPLRVAVPLAASNTGVEEWRLWRLCRRAADLFAEARGL